jgi:hypothetical protein
MAGSGVGLVDEGGDVTQGSNGDKSSLGTSQ